MKEKSATIIPEKIRITSINIFRAKMETTEAFLEDPKKPEAFDFGISNEMAHNVDDKKSRCRIFLDLEAHNSENEPIGLSLDYGLEFQFYVDNFSDFFKERKSGKVDMDITLAATLLAMAYSTARGVVYERTRGTYFDGILLPVIDPFKVLENNEYSDGKSRS